jgi:phage-related tail protein
VLYLRLTEPVQLIIGNNGKNDKLKTPCGVFSKQNFVGHALVDIIVKVYSQLIPKQDSTILKKLQVLARLFLLPSGVRCRGVLAAHLPLDAIRFISKTKSSWRVSGTPPEGNKKSPKQIAMKKSCLQERKPVRRIPSKSMSGDAIGPVTNIWVGKPDKKFPEST